MNYLVNGKEIIIGCKKINFNNEIFEVEDIQEFILITLKNISTGDIKKQPSNNIVAIDMNANIKWKISEITKEYSYYSGFYIDKIEEREKVIVAIDCSGIRYTIRLSDLTIINRQGYRF